MPPPFIFPYAAQAPVPGASAWLEWLLTDPRIRLAPLDPAKKSPQLPCRKANTFAEDYCDVPSEAHHDCAPFNHGCYTAGRKVSRLVGALHNHPSWMLGAVPDESLMIVDFDTENALAEFLTCTGTVMEDQLVVRTARGFHLYLSLPESARGLTLKSRPGIDLIRTKSFIVAPGSVRADGTVYQIVHGTWGHPQPATGAILDYFTPATISSLSADSPCSPTDPNGDLRRPGPRLSERRRAKRLRAKIAQLTEQKLSGDPHYWAGKEDCSESADLCSMYLFGFWAGMDVCEVVREIRSLKPTTVAGRVETRSHDWFIKDAARVYKRALGPGLFPKFVAAQTRQRLCVRLGESSRGVAVFDYIIEKMGLLGLTHINVGLAELSEQFGVSEMTASRDLTKLIEQSALTRTKRHYWSADPLIQNRTAEYTATGLTLVAPQPEKKLSPERSELGRSSTPTGSRFSPRFSRWARPALLTTCAARGPSPAAA